MKESRQVGEGERDKKEKGEERKDGNKETEKNTQVA